MPDDTVYLRGDNNSLVNALREATQKWSQYKDGVENVNKATLKAGKESDVLTRTLVRLTEAGEKITTVQRNLGRGWKTVSIETDNATKANERALRSRLEKEQMYRRMFDEIDKKESDSKKKAADKLAREQERALKLRLEKEQMYRRMFAELDERERVKAAARQRAANKQRSRDYFSSIDDDIQAKLNAQRQYLADTERTNARMARLNALRASLPQPATGWMQAATTTPTTRNIPPSRTTGTRAGGMTGYVPPPPIRPEDIPWHRYSGIGGQGIKSAGKNALGAMGNMMTYGGIYAAYSAARESIKTNLDLAKGIGEIETISQDAQLSTQKWREEVQRLAITYGKDVKDQMEAVYQTVSNQVAKGEEAVKFVDSANKFALAAVTSTENSVNLLSSVINAYGIDVSRTDEIAGKLFKTIELGRVRADEFANTFGNIAIIAAKTGVSLDDLLGSVATLTIQGEKYANTATQMRGILLKLLKPTDEMKKAFRSMGVETAEELLRMKGLAGTLEALMNYTDGNTNSLAKLINRERGLIGVLGLTGKQAEYLIANIKKITEATESYDNATKIMSQNLQTRYEQNSQALKAFAANATQKWLEDAVEFSSDLLRSLGLIPKEFKSASIDIEEGIKARSAAITKSYEARRKEIESGFYKQLAEARKVYYAESDAALEAHERIKASAQNVGAVIVSEIISQKTAYEKLFERVKRDADNIASTITDLKIEQADFLSEIELVGTSGAERIQVIMNQIKRLKTEHGQAFKENDLESYKKIGSKILGHYKDLAREQKNIEKSDERSKEKRVKIDEKIAKIQADAARKMAEADAKYGIQRSKARDIKVQIENEAKTKIAALERQHAKQVVYDIQHNDYVKQEADYAAQMLRDYEAIGVELRKQKELMQPGVIDRELKREELSSLVQEFKSFKLPTALKKASPEELANIADERATLMKRIRELGPELGVSENYLADFEKTIAKEKELIEFKLVSEQKLNDMAKEKKEIDLKADTVRKAALEQDEAYSKNALMRSKGYLEDLKKVMEDVTSAPLLKNYFEGVDTSNLTELAKFAAQEANYFPTHKNINPVLRDSPEPRLQEIARLAQLAANGQRYSDDTVKNLSLSSDILNTMSIKEQNILRIQKSKNVTLKETNELMKDYSGWLDDILKKLDATVPVMPTEGETTGEPETLAYGGLMRGNDMIPALLQKGEIVLNRNAARRFQSQALALNGVPSGLVRPGNTTTVGDVNVTLQSTGSTMSDARSIASEVKRLVKRGLV